MSSDHFQQAAELFEQVRELAASERVALLDEACAEDQALRDEVESLLKRHDRMRGGDRFEAIQEEIRNRGEAVTANRVPNATPRAIGRYEIKAAIASGGMGTVYRAVQDHPHRVVALKVLRQGVVSPQAIRRFRHEAEILGRLKHPNIAQVHDAGTFDEGEGAQPFFAMELIEGAPLTRYAESKKLGTRDRLRLFEKVCDAVQYAHHRGVIHRDLKPDNIFVDEHGEPKILDFGVARATDADIQVTTLRTDVGQLIGTIPYMSPEQVSGNPDDLDTRSDVYSLGVVLFELLTGRLPHELAGKTIPEAVRIIGGEDPQRLSTIDRALRGDLDTIVAKALEHDKTRRYQSAGELGTDIRHQLDDEPIAARPASTFYQLRKFARRNKTLVSGVVASFALLLAGTAGITWQWQSARAEAAKQRATNEFVMRLFSMVNPGEGIDVLEPPDPGGRLPDVEALLDKAGAALETDFAEWPEVRAELHLRLGRTYWGIGRFDEAEHHFHRAHEIRAEKLGADHLDTLTALLWKVSFVGRMGGPFPSLVGDLGHAVEGFERHLGPRDRQTLAAKARLGHLLAGVGRQSEGMALVRDVLDISREAYGEDDRLTLFAKRALGWDLVELQRYEEAYELLADVWQRSRATMSEDDIAVRQAAVILGDCLERQGRFAEAKQVLSEAIELGRRSPEPDLTQTDMRLSNYLAGVLVNLDRHDEAEVVVRQRLADCEQHLGDHPYTLWAYERVSWCLELQGRHQEAADLLIGALARMEPVLEDDILLFLTRATLARSLEHLGKFEEAEAHLRHAADETRRRELQADLYALVLSELVRILTHNGKRDEAESVWRERLEVMRGSDPEPTLPTLKAMHNFAVFLKNGGPEKLSEAEEIAREVIDGFDRLLEPDDYPPHNARYLLGVILRMQGRAAEAEAHLRELSERVPRTLGPDHRLLPNVHVRLSQCLVDLGRYDEAETMLLEALLQLQESRGLKHMHTRRAIQTLIDLYDAWAKPEEAAQYRALLREADAPDHVERRL